MNTDFKKFLSEKYLRETAGDKAYARGQNYYNEGRVQIISHIKYSFVAEVEGSFPYRTRFSFNPNGQFYADCTCPAMYNDGFCKHAVAAGLYFILENPPLSKKKEKQPSQDIFSENYPYLAKWVKDGTIEIGRDGYSASIIRVCDEGECIYEGGTKHVNIHDMLLEANQKVKEWLDENE